MKFILGKKIGMSERFQADGKVVPVTMIQAGPCPVTQVRTKEKDGYQAVQLGFGAKKKLAKPLKGHLKELGLLRYLREFRIADEIKYKTGDKITVETFEVGNTVKVTGTSKGKGFQGVVKRHHFAGGPASHGHKDNLRAPGSIGATDPGRVFKGVRMAGRMGGERVSVRNLKVVEIDKENNLLYLNGAVPGCRNSLVMIQTIEPRGKK
ncbi:MAG: 50S ribosomal protein L3 [Patescibacteria group bacterium]|nr:50S ribosomal protein L3 [Patescibacteria group bacterium]